MALTGHNEMEEKDTGKQATTEPASEGNGNEMLSDKKVVLKDICS